MANNSIKVLRTGLIVTTLSTSTIPSAVAQLTYKSNTVYRAGTSEIIISGTPNTKIAVNEGNYTKTTSKTANACGQVRVTPPKSGLTNLNVNGVAIDVTTLTSAATAPRCSKGTLKIAQTAPIKTATGTVVVPGLTPNAAIPVSYDTPKIKNVTINSCGFGTIKTTTVSPTLPVAITIGGTSYTTASLTDAGQPPKLQKVNGAASCYTPSGWTN
jgi:hypothetical protein